MGALILFLSFVMLPFSSGRSLGLRNDRV